MMTTPGSDVRKGTERPSVPALAFGENESMFRLHLERSCDPIWLFDAKARVFVDCNQAAVELMRAGSKENLLQLRPEDLSPPVQPDGCPSELRASEVIALAQKHGGYRFEWLSRRFDGQEGPLEVLSTPISTDGNSLPVVVSRVVTQRTHP